MELKAMYDELCATISEIDNNLDSLTGGKSAGKRKVTNDLVEKFEEQVSPQAEQIDRNENSTSTDEEKFRSMVEAIDFNSIDDFQEKLNTLKENFFESEETVVTPLVEEFATDEEEAIREQKADLTPSMSAYTEMLKKVNNSAVQNKQS